MNKSLGKFINGQYPERTREGELMKKFAYFYILMSVLISMRIKMPFWDLFFYVLALSVSLMFAVLNVNCIAGTKSCTMWSYVSLASMAITTLYTTYVAGLMYTGPVYILKRRRDKPSPSP